MEVLWWLWRKLILKRIRCLNWCMWWSSWVLCVLVRVLMKWLSWIVVCSVSLIRNRVLCCLCVSLMLCLLNSWRYVWLCIWKGWWVCCWNCLWMVLCNVMCNCYVFWNCCWYGSVVMIYLFVCLCLSLLLLCMKIEWMFICGDYWRCLCVSIEI